MLSKKRQFLLAFLLLSLYSLAQPIPAADQTEMYFPLLKGKKIGIVANQTSLIGQTHLVDSLLQAGFSVIRVFAPEHGFRGQAEAGALLSDGKDPKTGLPIVSLYGKHKKPFPEDLKGIDILIFDIQDVGARFYTYISTLAYVMEACAENNVPLLLLDRPNPNGNYVDGPVLEKEFQSFIGLLPIPVVHGMTLGEMAQMINGEGWLQNQAQCNIKVIPVKNYTHQTPYHVPIAPSPNLPNDLSIELYPSLCFFEGTPLSIGRGTEFPFQVLGYPAYADTSFSFTPKSIEGKSLHPKFKNERCYGIEFNKTEPERVNQLNLQLLMDMYAGYPDKEHFFTNFFNLLAGNNTLQKQIAQGLSVSAIRASWEPQLEQFKTKRTKYLLYAE